MLSSPVASRMAGVSRYAREHGWHLMFQDRMGFAHPFDWMGDGVIATIRQEPRSLAFLRRLARRGVPIVDLTCDVPRFPCARVSADHVAAGRIAAEHLAERNYRSHAFFSLEGGSVRDRIWRGFTESGPAERWCFADERPNVRWNAWDSVTRWLAAKFAASGKPLGVLSYSQGEAARFLDVALGLGIKVPHELGIIAGNDDPVLLENQPVPISAVDTDLEHGAYEAAALLDRLMERQSDDGRETFEIQPRGIVVRQSTAESVAADSLVAAALRIFAADGGFRRGIEEIAGELGVARNTLDRRFAAEFGRSASAELHRMRLATAKRLLANPRNKVEYVARITGFSSASHLGTALRSECGLPPSVLRQR